MVQFTSNTDHNIPVTRLGVLPGSGVLPQSGVLPRSSVLPKSGVLSRSGVLPGSGMLSGSGMLAVTRTADVLASPVLFDIYVDISIASFRKDMDSTL